MIDPQLQPHDVLQRMADALARHDAVFVSLASKLGGRLTVNHHNRPSRSITVHGPDGLYRQIEVCAVLRNPRGPMSKDNWTFYLGVSAWKDTDQGRLHWSRKIGNPATLPATRTELVALLEEAWSRVLAITVGDLSLTK